MLALLSFKRKRNNMLLHNIAFYLLVFKRRFIDNSIAFIFMSKFFSLISINAIHFIDLFIPFGLAIIFLRGWFVLPGLFLGVFYSLYIKNNPILFSLVYAGIVTYFLSYAHVMWQNYIGPSVEIKKGVRSYNILIKVAYCSLVYSICSLVLFDYHGLIPPSKLGFLIVTNSIATFISMVIFYPCLLRLFNIQAPIKEWFAPSLLVVFCISVAVIIISPSLLSLIINTVFFCYIFLSLC